jgi:hypothetical protein
LASLASIGQGLPNNRRGGVGGVVKHNFGHSSSCDINISWEKKPKTTTSDEGEVVVDVTTWVEVVYTVDTLTRPLPVTDCVM